LQDPSNTDENEDEEMDRKQFSDDEDGKDQRFLMNKTPS